MELKRPPHSGFFLYENVFAAWGCTIIFAIL